MILVWDYKTAVTSQGWLLSLKSIYLSSLQYSSIPYQHTTYCTSHVGPHSHGLRYEWKKKKSLLLYAEHTVLVSRLPPCILRLRVHLKNVWSYRVLVDCLQDAARLVGSLSRDKRPIGGALGGRAEHLEGQSEDGGGAPVQIIGHHTLRGPGSAPSRTGRPWILGNSGTADGGGTCRRFDSVASHCHTLELCRASGERGQGRQDEVINRSLKWYVERQRNINSEFTGCKPPLLPPCLMSSPSLKTHLTPLEGWNHWLLEVYREVRRVYRVNTTGMQLHAFKNRTRVCVCVQYDCWWQWPQKDLAGLFLG